MSLLSGSVNEDAAANFSAVVGRRPALNEFDTINNAWSSMSTDGFRSWAANTFYTDPGDSRSPVGGLHEYETSGGMMASIGGALPIVGSMLGPVGSAIGAIGAKILSPKGPSPVPAVVGSTLGSMMSGLIPGTPSRHSPQGPAPKATFFGGECPPGRKLRRIAMGRDVCIKTPRMNPFNPRALARADRRVTAFARRSKAILQDLGYHVAPRKKSLAKKKRRR